MTEGHGKTIVLIAPERWDARLHESRGVFLLFELFQIRSIVVPFSEVSLDIVEYSSKPVIFQSPAHESLRNAPVVDGKVKFSMIREGIWNKLLFGYGRPLIFLNAQTGERTDIETKDKFPLLINGVKEMFLGPEGEVKILNA